MIDLLSSKDYTVHAKGHLLRDFSFYDPFAAVDFDTPPMWSPQGELKCEHCAANFATNGLNVGDAEITVRGDECPFPDGITTVIEISVPSGKLLVVNTLEPTFSVKMDYLVGINQALGRDRFAHQYEEIGVAYGYVGNTSPTFYRVGDNRLVVANVHNDDIDQTDEDIEAIGHRTRDWDDLGMVVTDVWSYEATDYQRFVDAGGDLANHHDPLIIDVEPSLYRFTHHEGEAGFDCSADVVIYSEIERVESTKGSGSSAMR